MKKKTFDAAYLSSLCMELHLMLSAGIPLSQGVGMLAEGESDREASAVLSELGDKLDAGEELHTALRSSGAFPPYMTDLLEVGWRTGRTDAALKALSEHYDRQDRLSAAIRDAVVYPVVLLAMLLFVFLVLITKVLPIFDEVFGQLGRSLSGASLAGLRLGMWLSGHWLQLLFALAALAAIAVLLWKNKASRAWLELHGPGRRLAADIASARFAAAMSMAMRSGLDIDESLNMSSRFVKNTALHKKLELCRAKVASGESFVRSLEETGIFSAVYCRMLAVGIKTGQADLVMVEIARRSAEKAQSEMESLVGRVEPTLVIAISVLVGLVLLSVMLPLMGIMSGMS